MNKETIDADYTSKTNYSSITKQSKRVKIPNRKYNFEREYEISNIKRKKIIKKDRKRKT